MLADPVDDLLRHHGHEIETVTYASPPVSLSVECLDCGTLLIEAELPIDFENGHLSFDPAVGAAYLRFTERQQATTEALCDTVLLDLDAVGMIVGVELLSLPSTFCDFYDGATR